MNELLEYLRNTIIPTFDYLKDLAEDETISKETRDSIMSNLIEHDSNDIYVDALLWELAESNNLC